ncbi:hypothetical protein [Aquabacterium sp.]|uniref:hypothetical protein n=1 Tax=Aquabacterium sp. TaxID=1872578 RepID=UPI0024874CC5|nr:hypothetical protein [Aquabacterium sp.]MDI1347910.1 hypothetical protein [Aquabacterium sp.]
MSSKKASDEPFGFTVRGIIDLAGGPATVARHFDLSVQTVAKWGRRVPGIYARDLAILAGLPLAVVRPDHVQGGDAGAKKP